MFKKIFLLSIFSFSIPSYAYQKCNFEWNLSYNNISVGSTKETLYIDSNNYLLDYQFSPFKIIKPLGIPVVSSTVFYNNKNYYKKENKTRLFSSTQFSWTNINSKFTYSNERETKNITLEKPLGHIDLSIIPYLALVNHSSINNLEYYLLTQNDNPGIINVKLHNKQTSFLLEYTKDNFFGTIFLDENKMPKKFTVKNEQSNILGEIKNSSCVEELGDFNRLYKP